MGRIYERIFVIGAGAPALACLRMLKKNGIQSTFFETGAPMADFTRKVAHHNGFAFEQITGNDLPALFGEQHRTLVFSVNNTLLFPSQVVELENLRIFNYHNSLLPAHRGVHAEAWTIFNDDELAGISWHVVDSGIDTGPLFMQKSLPVGNLTSLELLKRQCDLAIRALSDSLIEILSGVETLTPQSPSSSPAHKRGERPNDGILDLSWPAPKIWNFLRAFDYGSLETLGKPRCQFNGVWHTWDGYCALGDVPRGPSDYVIRLAGIMLKNVSPLPT